MDFVDDWAQTHSIHNHKNESDLVLRLVRGSTIPELLEWGDEVGGRRAARIHLKRHSGMSDQMIQMRVSQSPPE